MHRTMRSAWPLPAILILMLMLWQASAHAAELAGHIIMVKGDVSAETADGSRRTLKRRDEIYINDTISTGSDSRVQIRFIDNALLALQADSKLSIHAYQQADADGKGEQALMELVEGGFRTLTGTIGKGNKEAYRVDTPVASIGIRGTMYTTLLAQGKLIAGVWKGGITLSSSQGRFDLGQDADFSFGELGVSGFQGMLNAPKEFAANETSAIASEDAIAREDTHQDSNLPPPDQADTATPGIVRDSRTDERKIPNPLDQDPDSGSEDTLRESGNLVDNRINPDDNNGDGNHTGNNDTIITSPDIRLSPEEFTAFMTSTRVGSMIVNDQVVAVSAFKDERGEPVFVSVDNNNGIDITRYNGLSDKRPTGIAGIEWGIWNGSTEAPVIQLLEDDSLTITAVQSPVLWVIASPVREGNIPTSGTVSFAGNEAIGRDSQGNNLLSASGSFDLNFSDGIINNGFLNAEYADSNISNQSIGGNVWSADFTGTINRNGRNSALAEMQFNYGYHGEGAELNTSASQFNGVLVAPDAGAFTGSFQLIDMNGDSAGGIVIWTQQRASETP
ncbi:MAG: FecR family protein [Saccharospirillaceae bacterium]|nr:FecR family protein [Saccharospirillaceae bacterium]MCD8530521.1 FecR family protein [Saccharospirillaceae bacterium]